MSFFAIFLLFLSYSLRKSNLLLNLTKSLISYILSLQAAANYLNSRHYQEALNVLSSISNHSAQWYYYSAIANSGLGNNVLALQHAKTAAQMEPSNQNYQDLVQRMSAGSSWYQQRQNPYGSGPSSTAGWCLKLCLLNAFLNLCCGGGGLCCGGGYPRW